MNKSLVSSLELSKELHNLGARVESEFWWGEYKKGAYIIFSKYDFNGEPEKSVYSFYPALLTGESGLLLKGFTLPYFNHGTGWQIELIKDYHRPKNEADARAMCIIHLIKEGIINPKDLSLK